MNPVLALAVRNPNCQACRLWVQAEEDDRCITGSGPDTSPKIAVVTKFPLAEDGRTKKELITYLQRAKIPTKNIAWLAAVKCRVWDMDPTKTDQKTCKTYLDAEFAFLQPQFVLAIGGEALFAATGKAGIMKYRGKPIEVQHGITVLPTISPAMVHRNPGQKAGFEADLLYFRKLTRGGGAEAPDHHPRDRVTYVDTKEALRSLREALQRSSVCSYDIETTGAQPHDEGAKIVSIAMTLSEHGDDMSDAHVWQIPLYHPQSPWRSQWLRIITMITRWMCRVKKLIAHNAKYDTRWLRVFTKERITPTFDTIIAASVLDENRPKGLKPLAQMLLAADPWGIDTKNLLDTPLDEVMEYNGLDTWHTLRLYYVFRQHLKEQPRKGRLFMNLLMPAVQELVDVEIAGVYVDRQVFTDNWATVRAKLGEIEHQLAQWVPEPADVEDLDPKLVDKKTGEFKVNWNASNFARWFLFDYLDLPVIKRGKRKDDGRDGDPSMAEDVMMELAEVHEVGKLMLERVGWNKFDSAFFAPWSEQLDSNSRMHSVFKPWGTVTGRLSSGKEDAEKVTGSKKYKGVNLQQVPRNKLLRGVFGAPPSYYFVEADYSQIELRIAAALAMEKTMLSLYQRGEDIHMAMAMRMTGKPASQVTAEERKRAKAVNFGFLYGMGWRKFIATAWSNYGLRVTEAESKAFRKAFFDQFPGLLPWHGRQRRLAHKYKRVETPMGRVRHLPDIDSADEGVQAEAERHAINSPVQGFASDMALLSLVHTARKFREWGVDAHPIGTVHDAVNFQVKASQAHLVLPVIKDTMENLPLEELFGVNLPVPIVADIKVGKHWGGATEVPQELILGKRSELKKWLKEKVPA